MYLNILLFSFILSCFASLRENVSHGVTKEGKTTWEKIRHRFICKVKACYASYSTKYLFVKHLSQEHSLSMELGKPKHPST
jgi:hypothetical protein